MESLTFSDFSKKYSTVWNNNRTSAFYTGDPDSTIMYDTHGLDGEFIKEMLDKFPNRVWTVIEADADIDDEEGDEEEFVDTVLYIEAGLRTVNRLAYVVTKEPWDSEEESYIYD